MVRIYFESIKNWAIKIGLAVGSIATLLFIYLQVAGLITVTSHSGDMTCAGTVEDPCYATMTFIANQDIFIYSTDYDPWGRNTPFNFTDGISSWKLERSWGSGWREIKLNESCMGTWCGAPDNKGGTYSFAFRKGKIYTIRLTAYKTNPNIDVKWSFTDELDPMWFGTNSFSNDKVSVKLISNTDNCFIDCEAEIEVCGKGNIPLKIDDKNFDLWFTDSKKKELARMSTNLKNSKLKNYDILIRENVTYIEDVPYYMECEDKNCTEIINNKTNEATILCLPYNYSCVGGYNQEIKWKYEYKIYNPKNPSAIKELAKNECVNFKIKGKKSPQLGENNIDWKINLAGLEPNMAWWNSSFGYRKAINITNPDDETLMIYSTVNITEDTATLIDDGKMQADCDDLKIVYNDVTELNRTFLDDTFLGTTGGCDDAATVVFFMLQQNITAGAESLTDYYMYYGYASADNPKNNTMGIFIIYDDFNRATLGSAWQQKGTCSISANKLAVASNADACQRNFDVGGVVLKDFKWYWSSILTGGDGHNHFRSINVSVMESTLGYWEIRNSSYRDWMTIESSGGSHIIYSAVAAGTVIKQDNAVTYSSGNWYNITTVHTNSNGQFITTKNGLNIGWDTTNLTSTISDGQIIYGMRADFNRAAANLDNILVMRYQEVPPISTLGIEEEPPSPFQPTSISLLFNGTAANQTILYGSVLNISAKINVSGIPVSLYKNGTLINNGITLSENMTDINWFSNATYNITAVWVGNSSYGASNATLFIFVNKTNPTLKFRNVGISNNTVGNTTYSYVNSTVVFYAEWYSDNGVNYTSNDGLNYTILQTNETGTSVNHTYEWKSETSLSEARGDACGGVAGNWSILANGYYPSGASPKTDIFKFDPLGSHAWVNTGKDITSSTYGTICSGFVNDTTDYFYWFVQTNAGWYDPLTGNQGSLSAPPVSLSTGGCAIPYGPHEGIHILRDGHWIYFPKNDSYRIDLANSTWITNWATCGLMKNDAGQDIMVVVGGVPDLNRTEIYNISENKWYNSTNVTIALGVLGAGRENVVFDNRLYLIYGMKQGGGDSYYNDIYEFNPERESWRTIITDGTGDRDGISISVIDDKIYALGGRNIGAVSTVQVLDLHHGSPKLMYNATTWKWANFTWSNHSIKTNGTVIEWKMCANNSLGNLTCTNAQYFTLLGPIVTPTSINLLINGSSANQTITYGDILNISAKINVSGIPVSLYKNGTLFNNDITTSENMTNINWFANATYNITAAWAGNSTFESSSATLFVFVNKASSTLTLALDGSSSTPQARTFSSSNTTDVQGNETMTGDSDCVYVLKRNGTSIPNGLHYLGVAGYNFTFSNIVCANYSANQVERMLTVNKATLTPTLVLDGSAATPQTRTYDSSNTTNVQGNATATGDSNCVFGLKRNNTNIPNGQHYLGVGGYNFTFYGTSCTNYTNPTQLERMLTVNKVSLAMTLVLDGSATTPQTRTYISTNATNIQGNETNSGDADCTYGLKRNGTNIPNGLHYLGVAGYNLTFYGESCSNYTNSQLERMLTVNKATPTFSTSVASPIIYETASDYTGSESNGGDGSCSYALKRNNVEIDTGSSVDDTTVLGVGSYNYTYYTDGCTNYTAAQDEETLAITKKTPGLSIVGISNGTYPDTDTIYWTSNDINGLTLVAERNTTNVDTENNTASDLPAGVWNYTVSTAGNTNYSTASSQSWYVIAKGTPSLSTSVTSPINYGNPSDYSGSESNTGDDDIVYILLVNNSQIDMGSSVSDSRTLAAGGYNYTYYTSGGGMEMPMQNWTFASSENLLHVAKISPTTLMVLTLDGSSTTPQTRTYISTNSTNVQSSETNTVDGGCSYALVKNGSTLTNGLHYLGAAGYNFTYSTIGCVNFTAGQIERLLTVNKASLANTLVLDGSSTTPQTRTFISTNSTNIQGNNSDGGATDCIFGLKKNTTNIPNGQHFLGAGGYNFTFYGGSCSNYTSSQVERLLTINKASGGLTLVLDGDATTPATRTFDPANTTNVQGNGTFSGDSGCSFGLKRNNTNIPNGLHYLGVAGYNFTFYLGGCSNYTNEQLERMLTVNRKSLTMTLVLDGSSATPQTRVFDATNATNIQGNQTGNTGDANCVFGLKRNTTNIPNGLHYLGAGGYNFTFYGESCVNYTNSQLERLLTVTKATTACNLLLDGIDGNRNYTANYTANFTVYTNVSGLTVKIDSNYTGWVLQSGVSPFENRTKLIHQGTNVNVTGYYEASANYTACSETHYFNIYNITFNVTMPQWKLYPSDDSYISSYGYEYCSINPYICRNTSQWNSTSLNVGIYGKYYNEWSWLKFQRNVFDWCNYAEMCLYKYGDTEITSSGDLFYLYYSHNQTWNEVQLTWDNKPDWVDSWIDRQNITDVDDVWVCWEITDEFCSNIDSNATYMSRNTASNLYTASRLLNFTVGDSGMETRAWDLYIDSQNTSFSFNSTVVNNMKNGTYEQKSYIRIAPNYVDFPGSIVNNASLMVYAPPFCNQSVTVNLYECREQNMTEDMTWNNQPYCSNSYLTSAWALEGWKTFNVTDIVQRAALSGGYQTSNISIMLGINTTFNTVNFSTTTFNDGTASKDNEFTGNENVTYYVKIPKYSNVITGYINITGKRSWGNEWNFTAENSSESKNAEWYWGWWANMPASPSCVNQYRIVSTHESAAGPSFADCDFILNTSKISNTTYFNWTKVYSKSECERYQDEDNIYDVRVGTGTCTPSARCFNGDSPDDANISCTDSNQLILNATDPLTDSKINITASGNVLTDVQGNIIAVRCRAYVAGTTSVGCDHQWYESKTGLDGSYIIVTLRNVTYGYPQGVALDFTNDGIWDWGKQTGNLTTTNRTSNLASEINEYLLSCSADADGYCTVPIVLHSDTGGNVTLNNLEINYTTSACWASEEYTGTTYDPRIQIGYTYQTKDRISNFRSNNYTNTSQRPYVLANISWDLNSSSYVGNSTLGYTYTPKGQMSSQWIYKVCSASNFGEPPMDVYLNLTSITNSTGSSLTALPNCVTSFWHYSNSTNVASASEQNITGNTAKKVLNNLTSGTCGYIWENITLKNCTAGDYWNFNWTWTACDVVGGC